MRTWAGRALWPVMLSAALMCAGTGLVHAQALTSTPGGVPSMPSGGAGSPGMSLAVPGPTLTTPAARPAAPPPQSAPSAPAGPATLQQQVAPVQGLPVPLYLNARFGKDQSAISTGMVWRIFNSQPDATGAYRLVKEEKVAAPAFVLPPGNYVIHASLGHATAVKQVTLRSETVRETFDIPAGGIRIEGRVGDVKIPAGQISFDLFKGSQFEPGDKRPLAQGILTGDVVMVPEGVYTIVSNYGDGNAVVRSDVRVQVNRLTDVTVTHRAAMITLKLVAQGGDALANTAWSVLTPGGDVIKESIGAFPRVVLGEGEYRAIARNEGKVYERDFKVVTGVDSEIAVVAR
jgi:hypothetical protein